MQQLDEPMLVITMSCRLLDVCAASSLLVLSVDGFDCPDGSLGQRGCKVLI